MKSDYFAIDHDPHLVDALVIHSEEGSNWSFPTHSHGTSTELSLLLEGQTEIQMGGCIYTLEPGDIIIKRPRQLHKELSRTSDPVTMVCLLLEGIHFSNAPAEEILSDSSHTQLISHDRNDLLKAIFFHMEKTHKSRPISAEMVSSLLLLLREMEADGLVKNPIRPEKAALVDTIRSYIAHNFDKKLTLQDLSSSVYISPCYMDRLFKKETGISINRYITECRMGEAERNLVFTNDDIKMIALRCGFSDIHYFYKVFKKNSGMTPMEFRIKHQEESGD